MSGQGAKKVAVIAGDGIGPEVVESALAVLQAAGAELEPGSAGGRPVPLGEDRPGHGG